MTQLTIPDKLRHSISWHEGLSDWQSERNPDSIRNSCDISNKLEHDLEYFPFSTSKLAFSSLHWMKTSLYSRSSLEEGWITKGKHQASHSGQWLPLVVSPLYQVHLRSNPSYLTEKESLTKKILIKLIKWLKRIEMDFINWNNAVVLSKYLSNHPPTLAACTKFRQLLSIFGTIGALVVTAV